MDLTGRQTVVQLWHTLDCSLGKPVTPHTCGPGLYRETYSNVSLPRVCRRLTDRGLSECPLGRPIKLCLDCDAHYDSVANEPFFGDPGFFTQAMLCP